MVKKCEECGIPLLSNEYKICEPCFYIKLKKQIPSIKFIKADGTETQNPDEAVTIQGIRLK